MDTKPARRRKDGPSQLMDLFLHVAGALGFTSDRDLADLAGASVENVPNWRSGAVQEFKLAKLKAIKSRLASHIEALEHEAGAVGATPQEGLHPLEIEEGSGPADLQRQFRDRVVYDYLGHRFLYYEPMGALAWENLIKRGYEQDRWLTGVDHSAQQWLDATRDAHGWCKGPIAHALGFGRRTTPMGLDVISLGPGEGDKEHRILQRILEAARGNDQRLGWLAFAPVDVSIPLLLNAARGARAVMATHADAGPRTRYAVKAFCADFEEGKLAFATRLPTAVHDAAEGLRLVLILGNVFGNLRDEEGFVQSRLRALVRPRDLVWLEVGLRMEPLERDPLFRMTLPDVEESAVEANRRLLLEGPYRRWEAATGRPPGALQMRIWTREDDESCRVPGAVNFCHDLILKDERRVCTMLYSRRYELGALSRWFERLGFEVLRVHRVEDGRGEARVAHVLLRAGATPT
ncbi:MAG: L-histidine N(alpha)-methyltransferase [Myxococcales bacterium]|nr:L-histidine N(alpha)-methyltransferase [Myxococcales bacterium]MCB9646670.1 L-histidine N(alpha)-methyltransferase [Deltaproteobacteria bacterium]